MNDTPRISIIVPVYNVEAYLDRCVESLLAQSWENIEIVLVNDGSKDNSGALCDAWCARNPRIRAVHKPNGGLSSARNEGLRHVDSPYVMFIDSDDAIHPDMCRHLLQAMLDNQAQIATCEAAHTFDDQTPPYTVLNDWQILDREEAIRRMWYQTGFFPSACTKLYRTELFAQQKFTEGLLYEDVDIMHRLLWQADKIVCTNSALYAYMHRGESITNQTFKLRDLDILTIADRLLAFAEENAASLLGAARAYAVTAAMRVELNAPKTEAFAPGRDKARSMLRSYGKQVLFDKHTRMKSKCGLLLYYLCRPLMGFFYKRVDRWK